MSDSQNRARSVDQRRSPCRAGRVSRTGLVAAALALGLAGACVAGGVSYSYDALGRLAIVVYSGIASTTTITYSYDAAGNRSSVSTTVP